MERKSLNGHAIVVGRHATVGRLSNNVFGRFEQLGKFLKKVTERSRDSGRRSRDRRPTVKQRFFDVSSNSEIFWKKSLNGHATVVGGHATVRWLSGYFSVVVTQPAEYCTSMRVLASPSWLNIKLTLLWIHMYNRSIVGQSSEGHVTVAWPSFIYTCIYEWEREIERERVKRRESISVTLHTGTSMLCSRPFH